MPTAEEYREVGEAGWRWVLGQVRGEDGPWLPPVVADHDAPAGPSDARDTLLVGIGGLAPALAETRLSRPWTDEESFLAAGIVRRIAHQVPTRLEPSLYVGLAGDAVALRLLAPGSERAPLARLLDLATAAGWSSTLPRVGGAAAHDLLLGNAGVVLTGVWIGGPDGEAVAAVGADALLSVAERTASGLDWLSSPGWYRRLPNYSHGTAGIAAALAAAGQRLGRADLVDAARLGAEQLFSIADLSDDGFRLPHYVPHGDSDEEPVTYSWCHGPTGTSYLFAALAAAGVGHVGGHPVHELHRRCLHAVEVSGVPERLRPGFWDNDGRCCGTAGVGDVFLDAAQAAVDTRDAERWAGFARRMADALVERAELDDDGARWRFREHRQDPPVLDPGTGWMQGAAGIAAFLMRTARVLHHGLQAPVVDRPDSWWALPAELRVSGRPAPGR